MVVLTLGHFDDSISGAGDDFVIPLENLRRRKRTGESARNLSCDSYKSCLSRSFLRGSRDSIYLASVANNSYCKVCKLPGDAEDSKASIARWISCPTAHQSASKAL